MEILLAIVVAAAVIFFGALITMGNERQRRAIDELREQVVLWAVQDLKIKREHLAQAVQVPDPLGWLNKAASKVCGYNLKLQVLEIFERPQSLVCISGNGDEKVVISPLSPTDIIKLKSGKKSRLEQFSNTNPLLFLPNSTIVKEISVLNGGITFDLELQIVWRALTGLELPVYEIIWIYVIHPNCFVSEPVRQIRGKS
ncbi:MAG: hypothetical protein AB1607_18505 [Chloroflexota bacterium]